MKNFASMIVALIFIVGCSESEQRLDSTQVKLNLDKHQSYEYEVGSELELSFDWEEGLPMVYFSSLNTTHVIETQLKNQNLLVQLPSSLTAKAGSYHINALFNSVLYQLAEIHLSAAHVEGKLISYIGPKSILNDGAQESEITAFPIDSLRNPTGTNSSIDLNITDDALDRSERLLLKENYITRKFTSVKGTSLILGVQSDSAYSEGNQIRTLSLCPAKINFYKEDKFFVADGRQFFKVRTDFLKDKNGQQIADATIAIIRVMDQNQQEVAEYKAYAVNGVVSSWIQNPSLEGSYDVEISICDVRETIPLGYFSGLVNDFKYLWKADEIIVGPITNKLGQFVPDGSPIAISLESESIEQTVEKHIVDGYAKFDMSEFWFSATPKEGLLKINKKFYKIGPSNI